MPKLITGTWASRNLDLVPICSSYIVMVLFTHFLNRESNDTMLETGKVEYRR